MERGGQAELVPTSRGGVKLHYEGYEYRIRDAASSGKFCWKCGRARKEFQRPGDATADGQEGGARVLSTTQHS